MESNGLEVLAGRSLASARDLAHQLLMRVSRDDSYINLLLPSVLRNSGLAENDRGLIQELSYGALRWQLQYDSITDYLARDKDIEIEVRTALRIGLHQLFRMRIPAHAAINETVELVKRLQPKAAGFANAILRNAERAGLASLLDQVCFGKSELHKLSIQFSHPEWVISALADALEFDSRDALNALLESNNETADINLAGLTAEARRQLEGAGLEKSPVSPIGFIAKGNPEPYLSRDVRVQDQGSQIVALTLLALAKRDGSFLDMCSGPGGKAAVLLSGMSAEGRLDCLEPAPHRAKLVEQAVAGDPRARVLIQIGQQAKPSTYDAVLLDAPCTGLGSLRRKPESRWRKRPEQISQLGEIQSELLNAGLDALKPGGVLLYSTCSPLIAETNTQISDALASRSDIELIDIKPAVKAISPTLELNPSRKTVQLWTYLHGTDSMFMAAFRKK